MKGILLVDKPSGLTSHDVVDRVRRAAHTRRVGHTGTLDPAATGLLVLCLGAATRLSQVLTAMDKVYEGSMRLGVVTDSHDMDGKVLAESPVPDLTADVLEAALAKYTGSLLQVPPMVSAVKIDGERLYKKARKGETVERAPRPVTVHEFALLGYEPPEARFRVRCTRGTYVRTLCHDVGQDLGCGATLALLRRTWVGHHSVEQATPLDALQTPDDVQAHLVPMGEALDLPAVIVREASRGAVASGGPLARKDLKATCSTCDGWIQIKAESGELLALGQVESGPLGLFIQPKRVFCGRP